MTVARHPEESPDYAKLRDELQQAEVELRDQRERVADLRRRLPRDQGIADATFEEIRDGQRVDVKLSELFEDPAKPLLLMHFMYGKAQQAPCPMCTAWADGYDGALPHIQQSANFAVFVAGDVAAFSAYARSRGWKNVRLIGAKDSDLKRTLGFETEDGAQHPGISVFERQGDGSVTHFYSQSAFLGEAGFRGMDLLSPIWHFLDLTPEGRGDFFPAKSYA
jgi:predicted dithiol-disulfide oxidoreductase (DUF899 family)